MSTSVLTLEEFLKLSTEEQEALPFKMLCRFQTELMVQALNKGTNEKEDSSKS